MAHGQAPKLKHVFSAMPAARIVRAAIAAAAAAFLVAGPPASAHVLETEFGSSGSGGVGKVEFDYPVQVAVAPGGEFYVSDSGNNRIHKFSADGSEVAIWGGSGGAQNFSSPNGLDVDQQGNLWVADSGNRRVAKFSPAGELLFQRYTFPGDVAVASQGWFYVSDFAGTAVYRYSSDSGALLNTIGPGQFEDAHGIATDPDGNVLVTDPDANQVVKLSPAGELLTSWAGAAGRPFDFPSDVALAPDQSIWVADTYNHEVHHLTDAGDLIQTLGRGGRAYGDFSFPSGVEIDPQDRVLVVDSWNDRSYAFEPGEGPPPDVTPPETKLTGKPKRKTAVQNARFDFTSSEEESGFICELDGSEPLGCEPKYRSGVRPGRHKFKVAAIDSADNVDPTPAVWRWRVTRRRR